MSDVEDLAEDLGVDLSEEQPADDNVEIITTEQLQHSEQLVNRCVALYQRGRENDLVWRWAIGKEVHDAYENEEKYESGILNKLSDELDISVSDLSRFKKFYNSFDEKMLLERAKVGYSWSHFKAINDVSDDNVKQRMISLMEQEDKAPKIKELQTTIAKEKEAQFAGMDEETSGGSSGGSSESNSSNSASPIKPVNAALRTIDKLGDYLTDIHLQEQSGIDFDTDNKEAKYNEAMDELNTRIQGVIEIYEQVWKENPVNDDES